MGKVIGGVVLFFTGIALGLYLGVWWAFVGGVLTVYEGAAAVPVDLWLVSFGLIKFTLASVIGYASAAACIVPALLLMAAGVDDLPRR